MAGFDAVEYLSFRLYPSKAVNKARAEVSDGRIRDSAEDYVRGADIFERALQALSPDSLRALVDDEQELEAIQVQKRAQSQEKTRFFHRPCAAADYLHWIEQPSWSLDEAVALILGKDPSIVTWDRVRPMVPFSEFAERFAEIRQHLHKARSNGQLIDPVRPDLFYRWAKARGVTIPAKLEALLDSDRSDLKRSARNDESEPGAKPAAATRKKAQQKKSRRVAAKSGELSENVIHLGREEARLKAMRDNARAETEKVEKALPELTDELAQSLRKMVLAMAIGRYGYKPKKGRQSTVTDISDDLQAAGIDLPPGAVRAMLEQASAYFSGNLDEKKSANG